MRLRELVVLISCLLVGADMVGDTASQQPSNSKADAAPANNNIPQVGMPPSLGTPQGMAMHSQQLFAGAPVQVPPSAAPLNFSPGTQNVPFGVHASYPNFPLNAPVMQPPQVFQQHPVPPASANPPPLSSLPSHAIPMGVPQLPNEGVQSTTSDIPPVDGLDAPHLSQPARSVPADVARNHMLHMQEQFAHMHPIAEMATKGLLPSNPPAMFSQAHRPSDPNSPFQSVPPPAGAPVMLPPPLLPQNHVGPSPQFQEMIKRLEKEHGGKLPPGLGAFTAPPPMSGGSGTRPMQPPMTGGFQPGMAGGAMPGGPMGGAMPGGPTGGAGPDVPGTGPSVIPSMALPRELPAQPKGPSIHQIMEIQRQHREHMDSQKAPQQAAQSGKQQPSKANAMSDSDIPFRSELVDKTVDAWIDQEIAKKSSHFKNKLGHIYQKKQERLAMAKAAEDHGHVANDYDPDGTVFLSKVSNVLSTEHPDMSNRLDKWIDRQVDAAVRGRQSHRRGDEDDDGSVWLQDALDRSDSEDENNAMTKALQHDFEKGMFFMSNKREYGADSPRGRHQQRASSEPEHRHHRKFKRRVAKVDEPVQENNKKAPTTVLLELDATSGVAVTAQSKWHHSQQQLFGSPVDHKLNMDPNDNRYRMDKDTNVDLPDYADYPLHKVISKHRKHGSIRHNKGAQKDLDKWVDLATGRRRDPFDGMFVGESLDFEVGDESDAAAVADLDRLANALEKAHSPSRRSATRYSHAWGD